MWLDHLLSREINGSIFDAHKTVHPKVDTVIKSNLFLVFVFTKLFQGIKINRYLSLKNVCVILLSVLKH